MTLVGPGALLEVLLFAVLMIAFWRQLLVILLLVGVLVFAVGLDGIMTVLAR